MYPVYILGWVLCRTRRDGQTLQQAGAQAGPKPGPSRAQAWAQARPKLGPSWAQARFPEIWKSGSWKFGIQQKSKKKSQNQNPFCPKCRQGLD